MINNENVNMDEPGNLYDMLLTDEQRALVKSKVDSKFVQIKDSEGNVEAKVQEVVSTLRIKVKEKIFHVDFYFAHMDNVLFHPEIIFQKWKYVLQRNTDVEGKLGEEALDWKKSMKVIVLMNIITDDSRVNDKLIKEFRKVHDRRKFVKLSSVTLN